MQAQKKFPNRILKPKTGSEFHARCGGAVGIRLGERFFIQAVRYGETRRKK